MKIQTKKSVKLIILSVVFALCLSFGIFYGNIETKSAYAATTPLYKISFNYEYLRGHNLTNMTSEYTGTNVSQTEGLLYGESKKVNIYFQIYGSGQSGTGTLANGGCIGSNSINIKTNSLMNNGHSFVITNSSGTTVASSTSTSVSASSLADGVYNVNYTATAKWSIDGNIRDVPWASKVIATFSFKVDTTAPTLSGASTSTTGKYVNTTFTVSASDSASGVAELYWKEPNATSYSLVSGTSKTISAGSLNGLYSFYAIDKVSNKSANYYVYYDSVKPTGTIKNSSGASITSAYIKDSFSFTASDSGSGISYLQYMTPTSSSWATYTSGTTIAATASNGAYKFRAVDKAGNISDTKTIYLDTVNPTGVLYSGTSAVSSGAKSTASYIKYVASDAASGIKTVYVKMPGASSYSTYTNGTQLTTNGTYSFYCVDNVNNQSATVTISLDNTKPTLSISKGNFGDTLNDGFTVSASDNIGGTVLYYKKPNGSFVQSTSTSAIITKTEADGTYQFYAVDGYGNQSATYSVTLNIAAPIATVVRASDGNKVCVIWSDSNCTATLNGDSYVNGSWIGVEGNHTLVLTNDAKRSSTYTFTIDHFYKEYKVVEATCTAQGYTTYKCDNCGNTYNANFTNSLGHNYIVTKVVDSTCTSEGYSVYVCTRCGDTYNDDVVIANGHAYASWYVVKEATCTETGIKRKDCVSCSGYETATIEATGHSYVATATNPTCMEQGYTTHTCSKCNATYVDTYVNAIGHNYVATVTAPTCTARGYTTQKCSRCEDYYIENYVVPNGHEYGVWRTTVQPTCTANGSRYKTCYDCSYKYVETIAALGHSYEDEVTQPTCVDKGYTTHTCSRCGTGYNDTFVNALGHDYQAKRVEPTCTEEGYIGQCCSRCSDTYKTDILKATGHDYVESYIPVTCDQEGCVLHICLDCQYEYRTDIVNPSGHSLETHVLLAATCTENGERYYGCSKCDYETIEVIPCHGHNYEIMDVTTDDGKIVRTYACTVCAHSYEQELGEQYEKVSNYVTYIFDEYSPYMIWVFLATAGVWSIAMGIAIIIANKNEDKVKAKKMLVNYGIGLIVIFAILVAVPYLVQGVAVLVTG